MNLPTPAVTEFLDIYRRKTGGDLTFDEANSRAESFLRLMMLLTGETDETNQVTDLDKNEKPDF
ncbi:MAG: hypothetical protein ACD_72C00242G0002 [uncultured bacterium]|nr:MAG: hypothetical protein ACD_72C00242G0002 [uncultured bacterium]